MNIRKHPNVLEHTTNQTEGGSGSVSGPAGATNNHLARFDGPTGEIIKDSPAELTDSGELSPGNLVNHDRVLVSGSNGEIMESDTPTETLDYLANVTSDIQDQLDDKQDIIDVLPIENGGTNSDASLVNGFIMVSDGGQIKESDIETEDLQGLDSNVQDQLDANESAAAAAQSAADDAQDDADTAIANAATAQTTANTGVTNAATAQSAANAAQSTANAALPKAGGTMTGQVLFSVQSTAVTANSAGKQFIFVTSTSSARTITMLTAECVAGTVVVICDTSGAAGTNNITVDTQGAETIDGANSIAITVNYGVLRIVSDGTNWKSF